MIMLAHFPREWRNTICCVRLSRVSQCYKCLTLPPEVRVMYIADWRAAFIGEH